MVFAGLRAGISTTALWATFLFFVGRLAAVVCAASGSSSEDAARFLVLAAAALLGPAADFVGFCASPSDVSGVSDWFGLKMGDPPVVGVAEADIEAAMRAL